MKRVGLVHAFVFCATLLCFVSFNVALGADDATHIFRSYCQGCHGADGAHSPATNIAAIGGQSSSALAKMLGAYQNGHFGGQRKQVMQKVTKRLSSDDIRALASYVSQL